MANQPNTAYVFQIPLRVIEPYIDHPERVSFINNQVASPAYATALTLIKRLGTLLIKQPSAFRFDSQVAFVSLLKVLFTELRDPDRQVANSDSVKQLLIFINDHSTEPLSVAALAREFGYNPNYLSRRFKQQVGISLIHYIYLVKLNHLYNDLVNTDTDIRQLFQKNGLTNPRTARKFFREMFGRLPSEVRQQKNSTRPTEKHP